jgi:hypothetical protein
MKIFSVFASQIYFQPALEPLCSALLVLQECLRQDPNLDNPMKGFPLGVNFLWQKANIVFKRVKIVLIFKLIHNNCTYLWGTV